MYNPLYDYKMTLKVNIIRYIFIKCISGLYFEYTFKTNIWYQIFDCRITFVNFELRKSILIWIELKKVYLNSKSLFWTQKSLFWTKKSLFWTQKPVKMLILRLMKYEYKSESTVYQEGRGINRKNFNEKPLT